MKILILAQLVTYSGVGTYIKQLSEQLAMSGDEVYILSSKYDLSLDSQISCHKFLPLTKSNIAKNYKIFKDIVESNKIDVVHIQHRIVGIYPAIYNLCNHKIPCTYILHTAKLEQNNFIKRLLTYTGQRAISISTEVEECLIKQLKINKDKISKVYNGVDRTKLTPWTTQHKNEERLKLGINSQCKVIGVHGRIDHVKGHDILIEAISDMDETTKSKLHVVVSGSIENNVYYRTIKAKIDELGLSPMFTFVGWVEPQYLLGLSDLMVAPSRREGFPLSAIEAFFMKVPVIRTRTGGYIDMQDYCIGIDVDSSAQLKDEILRFIVKQDLGHTDYSELAERAYDFANNNCSIEIMTSNTRKIFEEILYENKKS